MFTISDFERVRTTKTRSLLADIVFSVEKSEFAYVMNLYNSHDRGVYAERMLCNKLVDCGLNAVHCGQTCDYDILVNNTRIEVKLATVQGSPNGKSTKYYFHHIKPEFFDVLFFVFLNPYGTTIKWTTQEMFSEWSVDYIRGKKGYSIGFDGKMQSKKLIYNETFESFVRLTTDKP